MKKYCSLLILTILSLVVPLSRNTASADPPFFYKAGDTLSVISENGVVLRMEPDVKSKKIAVIYLADNITVIDDAPGTRPFAVGGVKGYWVRVDVNPYTGYMFDGFLSVHPAPAKCKTCRFNTFVDEYLDSSLKAQGAPVTKKDEYSIYTKKTYTNGFILEKKEGQPGLPSFELVLEMKNTRIAEAFLLFKMMGFDMLKGMPFPVKSAAGERKMLGSVYKEMIEVKQKDGDIVYIKIDEKSKASELMGEGAESEYMEFTATGSGVRVVYSAAGS